jgi:tetratricopeptide (TPR) repeat protein/tRNA A-37 threonylcarbamoyl transferase component Bud32
MADSDDSTRELLAGDQLVANELVRQLVDVGSDAEGPALAALAAALSASQRAELLALLAAGETPAAHPAVPSNDVATSQPEATISLTARVARDEATVDHWPTPTPHGSASVWLNAPAPLPPPQGDDRFRELRPLSAGGIGEVTVALDLQVHREVAIKKLLADGHDDSAKRSRFLLEGQVTGALEHPGIAPVYALGVDDRRRPYFAMRLIRGDSMRETIRAYHKAVGSAKWTRRDPQFRDLLRRLADVCITVAYAHSRGLLHRDLKPDNVMLGKFGETYVVDWGMARVMGQPADHNSLASEDLIRPAEWTTDSETRYGSAMGTPGYMSPEQATGRLEELTAATDVYSLGAMLYCLLTNRAAIVAQSLADFLTKVTTGEFPAPAELNPAVPPALSAICLKAMATKPLDRYPSARDLAADLDRWLADEPVLAAPDSRWEKAGRYARKNYRWLAPLSVAAVFVAVVASVASLSMDRARRRAVIAAAAEQRAKQDAEANFVKARETVDKWLLGYTEALEDIPVPGVQAVRARMLELAAQHYEEFVAAKGGDAAMELERGRTLLRLGSIHRILGRTDDARRDYRQALAVLDPLRSEPVVRLPALAAWATAQGLHAAVRADLGDAAGADEEFAAAIGALTTTDLSVAEDQDILRTLTTLETNRGGVLARAGALPAAADAFREAMAAGARLVAVDPHHLEGRRALVAAEIGAAQVTLLQGDAAAAAALLEKSTQFLDAASALEGSDLDYAKLALLAQSHLAAARRRQGDAVGEQEAYRRALAAAERIVRALPDAPAPRVNLAMMQTDLGQSLVEQFAPAEAEPLLRASVETLIAAASEFPTLPEYREALATALTNLAQAQQAMGQYAEAAAGASRATNELEGLVAAFPDVAIYGDRLAAALAAEAQAEYLEGDATLAATRFAQAVEVIDRQAARGALTVDQMQAAATTLAHYGDCLTGPDADEAASWYRRARTEWQSLVSMSSDPQRLREAAWFFALCRDDAVRDLDQSASLLAKASSLDPRNVRTQLARAAVAALRGQPDGALPEDGKASDDSATAPAFDYVRAILLSDKDADAAVACWRRAAAWRQEHLPGEWDLRALEAAAQQRLPAVAARNSTGPRGD